MEHKLSNLKQCKQITLSDEERAYLRGRIAQAVSTPAQAPEPLFQRGVQHGLRIALSSFLFVIFVGGSISAVASNALPGDPLYSFKINVNEEVKAAFLSTPEEKVAWQKSRVEKRVGEIKTLAETKTLTKEKQATAQKALDSNIAELSAELNVLSEESPNTALSVTARLEENLKSNKEALETTLGSGDNAAALATIETIDGTLKKVSEQEVKILAKEIENIASEVGATGTETSEVNTESDPAITPGTPEVRGDTATTTPPDTTPVSP